MKHTNIENVQFESKGKQLVGHLYLPEGYDPSQSYTGIVVTGSWTTVKEQMAGAYAKRFAEEGFLALAYDPRGFGGSQGDVMYYESPDMKIEDVKSAVDFLEARPEVKTIGAFGVCAGAGYTLVAASQDKRIAKATYEENGEVAYIPTISTTDETAAMFGPYDYYLNPERGAIPQWSADKFAVMTWEDWLTYNPRPAAKKLTTPTLMIHSDGAVLPDYTKHFFNEIQTDDKKLIWVDTDILPSPYHQFNFYDQAEEMDLVVREATAWFKKA